MKRPLMLLKVVILFLPLRVRYCKNIRAFLWLDILSIMEFLKYFLFRLTWISRLIILCMLVFQGIYYATILIVIFCFILFPQIRKLYLNFLAVIHKINPIS